MNIQCLLQVNLFLQVTGITSGRAAAIVPAVIGLIGVIIAVRAIRSAGRTGSGRPGAIAAMVMGLIGTILSGLHLARSYAANFGTGSGKAGAIVALVLGLISMGLGGLALARYRRVAMRNDMGSTASVEKNINQK
jgi:uncharacterized membrane protein